MSMRSERLSTINAIFFDAVGTLIHPDPSAAHVYHQVASRHGSQLSLSDITSRFRHAFAVQEGLDRKCGWQTSEAREVTRWQMIVREVLADVEDPAACFRDLYDYFAQPHAWRVETNLLRQLARLSARGMLLGVASNFDHRLRTVLAGMSLHSHLKHAVISSEVGWRKPAPQFFEAVCSAARMSANQILYIGDDFANDVEGAQAAGLKTLHVETVLADPDALLDLLA